MKVERLSDDVLEQLLTNGSDEEVRGRIFALPSRDRRDAQPLFRHQVETIEKLEANRGESGILHLPTGAGKTRIAVEIAARRLRADQSRRIVWASYPRVLIRQGMVRLVELASLFPAGTTFQWVEPNLRDDDLITRAHVTFMMRDDLTGLLEDAPDGRVVDPPLAVAIGPRGLCSSVTLIYDECHQLGAKELQSAWRKCERKFLSTLPRDRFQTIGLSATPLPGSPETWELLREGIFPIGRGASAQPDWGMLVHASVDNESLVKAKILCPVDSTFQDTGTFDIPPGLLARAGGERLRSPGRSPNRKDLVEFSERFNRNVMSDDAVLRFLADRLAANLQSLGKTLVFAPTIVAANRFSQLLKNDPRVGPGRVSLVHSRLNELTETENDLDDANDLTYADVSRQIAAFKNRGREPCVMVNVGMLTTGFDDPKIQAVLLARLTFSTNLFWQMVGRGARGVACGGTVHCAVIDPIRLTEKFAFLQGYRPQLESARKYTEVEKVGEGALDPRIRVVRHAPVSPGATPEISPTLRLDLVEALRTFVATGRLDSATFKSVAVHTWAADDGSLRSAFMPAAAPAPSGTSVDASGSTLFALKIRLLEEELCRELGQVDVDLAWLQSDVPSIVEDAQIRLFDAKLDFARRRRITTQEAFANAQAAALTGNLAAS